MSHTHSRLRTCRAAWAGAVVLLAASAGFAQTRSQQRTIAQPPAPAAAAPSPAPAQQQPQVVIRSYPRPLTGYDTAVPVDTSVMGGPAATRMDEPITDVVIARSFIAADGNRDGELTRAEATRLTLLPRSFEDMDLNRDGILSRSEYETGVR